jgi:hypothetical protein
MHRGHDHGPGPGGAAGHNRSPAQWQTPHLPEGADPPGDRHHEEDVDLVEKAFVEGFRSAPDPTSFLRLSGIPFQARLQDGTVLKLLRVALETDVDTGALTPHLGGGSFRYDPLPAAMVSRRDRLAFVYFDGEGTRSLDFAAARALAAAATG